MTYQELTDEVISRTFPEGIAENLEATYRKRILDGMIELQRWCPYFRCRQFTVVPFSATLFRQGGSYFCAPSGKIKRVATYTDDSLRDIVYYDPAERDDIDRLHQGHSRSATYPDASTVSVGYYGPTSDTDKGYRAERGIFAIDGRNLVVYPHIESGENILVEWDGIARSYDDADAVDLGDFEPQVIDCLSLYLRREEALREDRNTGNYAAFTGRWKQALNGLKLDTKEASEPETPLSDIGILPRRDPADERDYASNLDVALEFKSSGDVDPEGVVAGSPGDTYLNTVTEALFVKKTGEGTNTGWIEVVG